MILSICIPTYNRSQKVKSLLDSLFNQGIHKLNVEILVSNNGSTDQTLRLINQYEGVFRIFNQSVPIGFGENVKFLYSNAIGEFILLLGDDDELLFDNLKSLIEMLKFYNESFKPDLIILDYGIYNINSNSANHSHNAYLKNFSNEKKKYRFDDLIGNFYKPFVFLSGFIIRNPFNNELISQIDSMYYPQMDYALSLLSRNSKFLVYSHPICNWIPPNEYEYSDFRLAEKNNLLETDKLTIRKKYSTKFRGSTFWDERLYLVSYINKNLHNANLDFSEKINFLLNEIKSTNFVFLLSIVILFPFIYLIKKNRYTND
jgi:glycosyltransferase involved in cell wall biosynthesis